MTVAMRVPAPVLALRCWRESRPTVQFIFQLRFVSGFLLGGGTLRGSGSARLAAGGLVWLAATVAIYLLNGCTDVECDRINGSRRPVATGLLPVAVAAPVAVALGLLSVLGAAALSWPMLGLTALLLALGYAYSVPPVAAKRFPLGVVLVGGLGGFLTYLAGAGTGGAGYSRVLPFAGLLTAWMALVGGATKDLPDVAGDAAAGRHTVAGTRGDATARGVAAGAGLTVGLAAIVVAARFVPALALPAVVLAIGGAVVAVTVVSPLSTGSRPRRRRPYRVFMLTQYAAHLALVLSLV